jgi:photosystem II stability/assembly factor-like uncharacterized protein
MKTLYKILITLILFTLFSNAFSENLWIRQNSPVSTVLLNCVFTDSSNGWAAGDSGVIVHTSDGGQNWLIQNSHINYYINDIFFINKRLGWAVANEFLLNGSTILKTTDGGIKWSSENFYDSSKIIRTVYFQDSLNGFLGGFEGVIFKTTNAGSNWIQASNDSSFFSAFPVTKFIFTDNKTGFACGGQIDIAGVIWKTTDGGLFWESGAYSPEPFYDIEINSSDIIFAAGGDFEFGAQISKTGNFGQNWVYQNLGFFGQAQSIAFRTPREVWMPLGFSGLWAVSGDSGNSWTSIPVFENSTLYSVVFPDSLHGWAVGTNGTILKYNYVKVGIKNQEKIIPGSFILYQNYPNPFNPVTVINYSIPVNGKQFSATQSGSNVKLTIYNALGKEVQILVNEKQNGGNYSVEWNAESFPGGIYFYQLVIGNFSETKKMIHLN